MADKFQFIENSQHSDCLVTKVNYPWLHFSFDWPWPSSLKMACSVTYFVESQVFNFDDVANFHRWVATVDTAHEQIHSNYWYASKSY